MRGICRLVLLLLWILTISIFVIISSTRGWWDLTPIIAYNKPQGAFGWLFSITVFLSIIYFVYYHLINKK